MEDKKSFEEPLIVFLSFFSTTLFIRVGIFFSQIYLLTEARVVINNIHIHHWVFGAILLLIAGILYLLKKRGNSFLLPLGIGLGLAFDEYSFWGFPRSNEYCSIGNFSSLTIISLLLLLTFFANKRKYERDTP